MAQKIEPVKTSISTQRKLSIAVGLLSFSAFVIQALGQTWGFEAVATQIVQTCLAISGGISIYFLGSTTQKITEEKKQDEEDK
jgi:hypothetical protein